MKKVLVIGRLAANITKVYEIAVTNVELFAATNLEEVRSVFERNNNKIEIVIIVFVGATLAAVLVSMVAGWINVSINSDEFYDTYLFQDTAFPLVISILFICVQPAIFEEVAFRGFLFNNLQHVASTTGAVYVTSFMFGIMHLSYISLIWLVPLGIISALMRTRFNTLWYGMIAHFTYNLTIVLIDFQIF